MALCLLMHDGNPTKLGSPTVFRRCNTYDPTNAIRVQTAEWAENLMYQDIGNLTIKRL